MSQRKNLQTSSTQYKFINLQLVLALVLRVDTVSHQGMWCPPSHALQPAQPGSELLELPKGVGRPLLISIT